MKTCRQILAPVKRHPFIAAGLILAVPVVLLAVQILGYIDLQVISTPGNPASGFVRFFANSSGLGCLTSSGGNCLSAAPSGTAGGDLSGSYPNPTVAKVNGGSVPASQTCLGSNSSSQLIIGTCSGGSGALTQISQQVVSGSMTTDISFTSISGSYSQLKLIIQGRSAQVSSSADNLYMYFNSDTMAHYDSAYLCYNSATGVCNANALTTANSIIGAMPAASSTANAGSQTDLTISGYAATTFFKQCTFSNGTTLSGVYAIQGYLQWRSTSAITQIDIKLASGSNFVAGTIATLYGMM